MSEYEHFIPDAEDAVPDDFVERDDISAVLEVLRKLAKQTRHPVIRACLEQAQDDIVHLTTCGDELKADDDEPTAD